jgi:hypothetical protein
MAETSFHIGTYLNFFIDGNNFQKYFEFMMETINIDTNAIKDKQLQNAMRYPYVFVDNLRNYMIMQNNQKNIYDNMFEMQYYADVVMMRSAHNHALQCYNPYRNHIHNYKTSTKIQVLQHIGDVEPVCNFIEYNKLTKTKLLRFLTIHNIKIFLFYIFDCNLQKFRKCKMLLALFGYNMQIQHKTDWSLFVGKSFVKVIFDFLTNKLPLINENAVMSAHLLLSFLEQFPPLGDKFQQIHDCLCEYEGYHDFVHPIRQTRLLTILDETYEKYNATSLADHVFSNEYVIRIVRNFAFF